MVLTTCDCRKLLIFQTKLWEKKQENLYSEMFDSVTQRNAIFNAPSQEGNQTSKGQKVKTLVL